MAVETAADRLVFLAAADFGTTALYTPAAGGGAVSIDGIFDNDYLTLQMEGEADVATRQPRFHCRSADLVNGGGFGDTLVIAGITYKLRIAEPDGTGMTMLMLEKQ